VAAIAAGDPAAAEAAMRDHISSVIESLEAIDVPAGLAWPPGQAGRALAAGGPATAARPRRGTAQAALPAESRR